MESFNLKHCYRFFDINVFPFLNELPFLTNELDLL